MPKRRILLILTALCLVCASLGVQLTGAWFVAGGTLGGASYSTSSVIYLPPWERVADDAEYGALIDGNDGENLVFIVPGQSLLKTDAEGTAVPLSLENFSTTDTQVRAVADISLSVFNEETSQYELLDGLVWVNTTPEDADCYSYQYGIYTTIDTNQVFIGLLEFKFYKGAYTWVKNAGVDGTWDLTLNPGDEGETNVIPLLTDGVRQKYTVINSIEVVGNSLDSQYQTQFNTFFSSNFSGGILTVNLKYYAKQNEYMNWNQFSESLLNLGIG